MSKKAKDKKDLLTQEITQENLDLLSANIRSSNLASEDQNTILGILDAFLKIRLLVMMGKARLRTLLGKIYGLKTERRRKGRPKPEPKTNSVEPDGASKVSRENSSNPTSEATQNDSPENTADPKKSPPRKGGNGRNGRDDFPGGKKICVNHESLNTGDVCPDCGAGKLIEQTPKSALRFFGQAPIRLNIYLLQKLVCSLCGSIFSPVVPGEPEIQKDATGDQITKHKERVYDPSVPAAIVCQRFQLGVPHYRLGEVLAAEGLPIPASTQVKIMKPLEEPGEIIFHQLELEAAQADQFYVDDTHKRILEQERAKQPPENHKNNDQPGLLRPKSKTAKEKPSPKKRGIATAIVAETPRGKISLFYTGTLAAGKNLANLLKLRPSSLATPKVMCDGLAANKPVGIDITMLNCLDHARRKFYDLARDIKHDTGFFCRYL